MTERVSMFFIIARSVLVACTLFLLQLFPQQGYADDEEKITIFTGTSGPDIITISIMDILNAEANIQTEFSEKVEAAVIGIDSLEGNDTITINALITMGALANALLLHTPEKKTESLAQSSGVTAGEGDDSVFNNFGVNIFGSSLSAYGTALEFEQPAPSDSSSGQDDKKVIDASVTSKTEITGVTTGDGDDLVENDGLLTINGLATSGASAGDLTATVRKSSTLKSKSESDVSSTGIQAGGGSDTIINDAAFVTTATATSGALAVGLVAPGESTPPSDKKANIKTESNATSRATVTGIHGDEDELEIGTDDSSPFGVNGLRVTYEKTVTTVSGDDLIMNNALLTGNATATSGAGSGSISNKVNGSVQTEARAEAEATVTGINAGGGNDVIVNGGELLSTAIATSGALAVAVEVGAADEAPSAPPSGGDPSKPPVPSRDKESKSSTDASTTAKATATGITTDGDAHSETFSWALELIDGALVIDYLKVVEYLHGNDMVTNQFSINTLSLATSLTDSVGVTISSSGSAESRANAEAEAYGASIVTGSGDDRIINQGLLTTESTANATAVSVGLAVGQPPEDDGGSNGVDPPTPASSDKITSKSETNVSARAHGYGIDADGSAENITTAGSLSIGANGLNVSLSRNRELASGNDTVTNLFAMTVDSFATADSTDASIQIDAVGSVNSEARAMADALAVGIATGAGYDNVVNSGLLIVGADASADSISFGLSASKPPEGETTDENGNKKKDKTNVKTDASAMASATATGIDAEGMDHLHSTAGGLQISGSGLDFRLSRETGSLAGNDAVTNQGVVTATADATSGATSVGISINADGSVDSEATSRATARSGGILTGGGSDTVDNQAVLSSDSTATATALSVAVSVAQPTDENGEKPTIWEKIKEKFASANSKANAEATSVAVGIDVEGDAGRQVDSLNVNISSDGLLVDVNREFTSAAGNDSVSNSGALNATSTARTLAGAVDVKMETEGTAWSETNATARADAGGILTGGGADVVNNTGLLTALADAEAGSVAVSFTQPDGLAVKSKADSKAVAEATATGIGTDGGRESELLYTGLTIGSGGIDFTRYAEVIVSAEADTVINTGAVIASALTLSGAGGAAVSMDGPAKADVTAKSTSQAVAVDAGGGGDFIDNEGYLTTTAGAISGALGVGFGQKSEEKSKTKVEVEAGATSDSRAIGISGDSGANKLTDINVSIDSSGLDTYYLKEQTAAVGNDVIANRGRIDTLATSITGGLGVSVAIDGAAKADVNATSKSKATAIEGGGGDDRITSTGDITATADAGAIALSVAVGKKTNENSSAKTKVDASSVTEATATGIAGDGGLDDTSRSVTVTIDDNGLLAEFIDQTTAAAGNDEMINSGAVRSEATATSGAVSVAVTIDGAARADANSSATAKATGLDSGAGSDLIDNSGALQADASATSYTLNVAVSSDGRAVTNAGLMDGGNKAEASATGISSAGGQYQKSTTVNGFIDFNNIAVDAVYQAVTDSLSGDGTDVITNSGSIVANSTAFAPEVTAGITGDGLAVSIGRTQAEANASAINAGNLGDNIDNSGDLIVNVLSTAVLANVAVAGKGLAVATNAVWDGGTKAEASATGIDADSGSMTTKTVSAKANKDVAYVRYNDEFQAASGDDNVVNTGRIDASAFALAPSLNVAVEPGKENKTGIAVAVSTSSADAKTTAIRGGDGDDDLDNSGLLNATASATALSANVAVVNKGVAAAADAVWDGGTKAEAAAIGIAGDGGDRSRSTYLAIGTDEFKFEKTSVAADGKDNINNTGEINADATANAASVGVAVAAKGIGVATSTATAESRAAAIDAGSGGSVDDVYNSGKLTAESTARAAAASVSVTNEGLAVSADSVWDGGTRATAEARGIDVGAGGETLTNDGQIDAIADAETASASIAVSMKGVAGASSTSTSKADAIAIDASEGGEVDTITNNGALTADATSLATAASISVVNQGLSIASGAVWDGGTKSVATARGIDVGDGGDTINNTGTVSASSLSAAAEAAVGVAVQGVAGAVATSTSEATAVAIHAGDDNDNAVDTVINSGDLEVNARIRNKYFENEVVNLVGGVSAAVSFSNAGVAIAGGAVWDGGTKATADARGIELGAGADVVDNSGNISTNSDALVAELAASVSVSGVAGATATSTGESSATAIHAGSGNAVDTVLNSGDLTATSKAAAVTAAVSVTNAGLAVAGGAVWDGGTKGISQARGIYVGEGADVIDNSGAITAESTGSAVEVAAAISVSGVAGATATSTGQSMATAIDASEGDDTDSVINSGDLLAKSTANAATSTVTVTNAGLAVAAGAVWDGGTTATSEGRGIDVGAGKDVVENSGAITAESDARAAELGVSVAVTGVAGAIATSTGESSATAIDAGEEEADDDIVINSGNLAANSNALAATATVSVTTAGVAVAGGAAWEGGTKAYSQARGIEVGEGADIVDNSGDVDIWSNSVAAEAAVAVAVTGVAAGVATATSIADASAIDTGDGNYVDVVNNSGNLDVISHSLAATTSVSVTTAGVAVAAGDVWDGGTEARSSARGIEVGEGADMIENTGEIKTDAWAESASATISVAVAGVAGAISTATAEAESTAIDAGADDYDDVIINEGDVGADATAIAASAAVSFTAAGVAVSGGVAWDGGTTAESAAIAMNLGGGADAVLSNGNVSAHSVATSTDIAAAIAIAGVAGAITAANSHAVSTGIDTGAGNDVVETYGRIVVSSVSNSNTVANADSKFGVTVAGNNSWDGGTRSNSTASGITAGTGVDAIENYADIESTANSVPTASALTFVVGGVGAANSTATADARANAIDGGADNDNIDNFGDLSTLAIATAVGTNVALTGIGVGVAADAVWDGGTTSNSDARGIDGGDGDDVIMTGTEADASVIDAKADSTSVSTSIAVTVGGVAGAISTSTANADASGIAAGAGDDTIISNSAVTGLADANAASTSVSLTGVGVALASDSFWDGGTKTNAYATGLAGGAGNDEVRNLDFARAEADSDATSVAAAVSIGGIAGAAASATATANAVTLSGNAGDDTVINQGLVEADADATATGVSVTFTGAGVGVAGTFFEGGTTSDTVATGLGGGTGSDELVNTSGATIDVQSHARTSDTAVSVTLNGIAGAGSRATAISDGYGIAGGDDADMIFNEGIITQVTSADAVARSVSFTGAGAAISSAGSVGHSQGTGLAGGAGDDTVTNAGQVDLTSTAKAIGQSVSVTYSIGGSVAEANADAIAEATGISGNDGADGLTNVGSLTVSTDSMTTARAIGAAIGAGVALGQANSTSRVAVTGMSGGDDDDTIINSDSGEIIAASKATAVAGSVAITVGGVADAEARSSILADATGLSGGAGDDAIMNAGKLGVQSHSRSTANGASVSFYGVTGAKAGTEVETKAVGISGGDGADYIVNTGTIRVGTAENATGDERYMAVLRGAAASAGLAGLANAEASAFASTEATGIDGGDAADTITNTGDVIVNANSLSVTSSGALQIFGSSSADGVAGATTFTRGIDGGAGNDTINNTADMKLDASSELYLSGGSITFAGSASSGGTLAALTSIEAIQGGAGDDSIASSGTVNVAATSTMDSANGASAAFGGSASSVTSGGRTFATGFTGGEGNDSVVNSEGGELNVTATTDVSAEALSYTFGGGSAADTMLSSNAVATGLQGDSGHDRLRNDGTINVLADSSLTSTGGAKSTITAVGGTDASGTSVAGSVAVGLDGGEGDDVLESYAVLTVNSRSTAEAFNRGNNSISLSSDTVAGSITSADAVATGIAGGNGSNSVFVDGILDVDAMSIGYGLASSSGAEFSFDGDGEARVRATSIAEAIGITGGQDDDQVVSDGDITVDAFATTAKTISTTVTVYRVIGDKDEASGSPGSVATINDNTLPEAGSGGYEDGTVVFWNGADAPDDPNEVGTGSYMIVVSELVDDDNDADTPPVRVHSWEPTPRIVADEVLIEQSGFPSYAVANGNGFPDGDGFADARVTARAAAHGVQLGDGDDRIDNFDNITVTARADAVASVAADGDTGGDADGTTVSRATARATGLDVGAGDNNVYNDGAINVTATPVAQARTDVSGGDLCIWFFGWHCGGGGTGTGIANTYFTAEATGIAAGNGNNTIVNDGEINVIARPDLRDDGRVGFDYAAIVRQEDIEHFYVDSSVHAYGIRVADADEGNTIVNNGQLTVAAYDLRSGCDTDSCRNQLNASDDSSTPDFAELISATGIITGAGNDTVINNGLVSALIYTNNVATSDTGIDLGAGDDALILGADSEVTGAITLGDDDDSLTLMGTPMVRDASGVLINPQAGTGNDSLILQGAGAFAGVPDGFEQATKAGTGTYALSKLATLDSLTIDEGVLQLESDYDFAADGQFSTYVHGADDHGRLLVNGSATLDGAIDVEKRVGTYVSNGTRYSVLETTGSLSNAFADVTLPAPTLLLRYDLEQTVNTVDTVVTAESFGIVAGNPLYRQIARNLDRIASDATGDMADVLGTLQSLESGFDRAFASASPDSYLVGSHSTVATGLQMTRLLQNHLSSSRATYRHSLQGQATASGNVSFAYNNGIGAIGLSSAPVVAGHQDTRYMLAANEYSGTRVSQAIPQVASARGQAWIQGIKADGDYDEVDGYTDFDTDSRIVALGYDSRLSKHLIVGGTLGYAKTDLDMDMAGADGDIKAWSGGTYASWFNDKAYLEGGISYASQSFDNRRTVVVGSTRRRARSDHDGDVWMGFLGSGYRFAFNDWSLEPYGSLYYFNAHEDSVRETGAGSLNQIIDDRDTEALVGEVGASVVRQQRLGKGTLDWRASLGLNHDFDIDDTSISYGYFGAPGTNFTIDDRDLDSNSTVFGAGVSYTSGSSTLSLDYRRQHNSDYDNDAIYAGLVVRF